MYQEVLTIRFSKLIREDQPLDLFTLVDTEVQSQIESFAANLVVDQTDVTVTSEII